MPAPDMIEVDETRTYLEYALDASKVADAIVERLLAGRTFQGR
jgi:hypothetical protein